MRIELTIDGGFAYLPGLAKPIVLDGAQLAGDDLAEFRRLCQAALASRNRHAAAQLETFPDARRYQLTIDIDGERHDVTAADPVSEPAVAELIDFVRARGTR